MECPRRLFIAAAGAAGLTGAMACLGVPVAAQAPRPRMTPPKSQDPDSKEEDSKTGFPTTKKVLEENEKDIKKNIEKLFQLASDLKTEVEKTDSVNVLSLAMLRKADEIERLAHDIKNRAKG